jgi:hypothetical protein
VKNELVSPLYFVRQGINKKLSEDMLNNTSILENLLENTSDIFDQKERVSGKGIF